MAVIRVGCSCDHCGYLLSAPEVARAHFLKTCPACSEMIEVNAPATLTRSLGASAAGVIGMILGLGVAVIVLTALGIDEKTLSAWTALQQVLLCVAVVCPGLLLAYVFQSWQVRITLAGTREKLEREGIL